MQNEFVPYTEALELKELGFDEPCFGFYDGKGNTQLYFNHKRDASGDFIPFVKNERLTWFGAPTFSQCFRFFRDKYDLFGTIHKGYYWNIFGGVHDIGYNTQYDWDSENYNTYEEAELECLKQLIKIVKDERIHNL